jgi:hypothetical protein
MRTNAIIQRGLPAGVSFSVSELMSALGWVGRHGLALRVLIDRVIEDAEYEEMLVIEGGTRPFTQHVLWRTTEAVFEQHAGAPPQAYRSLDSALRALTPRGNKKGRARWINWSFANPAITE